MCVHAVVVTQAEQYHGVVSLLEKQNTEELRLEGVSWDYLVQLLFPEQNTIEQVTSWVLLLTYPGSQCLN